MIAKFIYESLEPDKIKLYRGDSSAITKFDADKFDSKAIYGPGLYLTDNPRVAFTYTLKGDHSSIITRDIYASSNKQKHAILCFIIEHLVNQVNETNFTNDELHDVYEMLHIYEYGYGKEFIERYTQGDKLFWLSKEYVSTFTDEKRSEYEGDIINQKQRLEKNISKLNDIHKKFDKYIIKATAYFQEHRNEYDFLYDGEESWDVIYKPKNQGKISEFTVDSDIINKCYDANKPMDAEVISILRKMVNHWLRSQKMTEYAKIYHWEKGNNFKYYLASISGYQDKNNVTLAKFLYNNSKFRTNISHLEKDDWNVLISGLKSLGYRGIVYNGGEHLNSPIKHRAYVIWDLADVHRVK